MRPTNMNARECKWLQGEGGKARKNMGRVTSRQTRKWAIERVCVDEREIERVSKGWWLIVCACAWWRSSENATEWENEGPCIGGGVECGRYLKQCTDLRPSARCVYIHPPRERKKSPPLPTPFLPLCVPSCNHRPPPVIAVMNRGPAGLSIIFCTV